MGKVPKIAPSKIWRISESAPLGEWVDPSVRVRERATRVPLDDEEQGAWVRSSFDLLDGIEMKDDGEPVPAEIFDELFSKGNNLVPGHKAPR